jgi:hypothetical protein
MSKDTELNQMRTKVVKYKQALKHTMKENEELKSNMLNKKHVVNLKV